MAILPDFSAAIFSDGITIDNEYLPFIPGVIRSYGGGVDRIGDFDTEADRVELGGFGFNNFAEVQARLFDFGGGPVLQLAWRDLVIDGVDKDETPRGRAVEIEKGLCLTVAVDMEGYHDIEELLAASVLWTLGVAAPVSLFAGYRLSHTATRRLAEIAETTVSDDGPGMPTSERDRVFERFYQGAEGRSGNSGSGLGLSLARSICSVHGFTIAALEVPGGAAFEVSIA